MIIYIELSEWLKKFASGAAKIELEVKDGMAVIDAIRLSGVPEEEVGFITLLSHSETWATVGKDYILKSGDVLKVYSPIIGG